MVIAEAQFPQLTPDEYLTWEEEQTEKYEYIEGQIYAMGGGNKHHSLIAVRLSSLFFHHLDGS
ncbi:MAG: Uma2 family endonuclease, partial [Synechococcus sp.]|nr:Uma2 family endonuclease [Synechococcus sp.]